MAETITIPKVGEVPKSYLYGTAGLLAAYVLWSYWRASQDAGDEPAPTDPGFEGEGDVLPVVPGALGPGEGGIPSEPADPPSTDQYGFTGTNNSQWTQYAVTQLTQADRWQYQDIVEALGNYLNGKPLDATDTAIVQAAIAVAGYPPVGSYQIKPGGETPITTAPAGVRVVPKSTTSLLVSWNAVPGAASYRLYRSGVGPNIGTSLDTTATIGGLRPGTTYGIHVRAMSAAGKLGPSSSTVKAKTKDVTLRAPTGLRVETGKTTARLTWKTVPGADGYRLYRSGASANVGASGDGKAVIYGLKPRTTYSFHVRAVDEHGRVGPKSASVRAKTKR